MTISEEIISLQNASEDELKKLGSSFRKEPTWQKTPAWEPPLSVEDAKKTLQRP